MTSDQDAGRGVGRQHARRLEAGFETGVIALDPVVDALGRGVHHLGDQSLDHACPGRRPDGDHLGRCAVGGKDGGERPAGRSDIPSPGHVHVDDLPLLVHRPEHVPAHPGDPDVRLVDEPAVTHLVPGGAVSADQQRCEPLHPPVNGDLVHLDATFGEELFEAPQDSADRGYQREASQDHLRWDPGSLRRPTASARWARCDDNATSRHPSRQRANVRSANARAPVRFSPPPPLARPLTCGNAAGMPREHPSPSPRGRTWCGLRGGGRRRSVIPGYTLFVKTAISIPDETFERASRRAHDLGMSRSEFFTRAAARYLDELDAESVTRQIDLAVDALGGEDDSSADAVAIGHRVLNTESAGW